MKEPDERYVRLGEAIRRRLAELDRSQPWLGAEVAREEGRRVPYGQTTVSAWLLGRGRLSPDQLFTVERVLALRAGQLSRMVGFLPTTVRPAVSVREAIDADPALSDMSRRALTAAYEQMAQD